MNMIQNRRYSDWEWYRTEAINDAALQFVRSGKIVVQRPFLLLLFSLFFEDMITWCKSAPNLVAFHFGKVGLFDRLRYLGYESRLVLEMRNEILGVVFFNNLSDELKPLAEKLIDRHHNEFPNLTVEIVFDAANYGITLDKAKEKRLKFYKHTNGLAGKITEGR